MLEGDVDRYGELVGKYQTTALRLAFSLLANYEDAKDISQEAFISAYRSLRKFRGGAKFSTWLYRIVVNRCKDLWRNRRRRPMAGAIFRDTSFEHEDTSLFIDVEVSAASPSEQLANRELAKRLSAAIGGLSMKQRSAFVLHHVHGFPLDEIASIMRCSLGTVKTHIFRATEHLKMDLEPWRKQEGF